MCIRDSGKPTLEDGTIAGSATCLAECFRRAVSFGVPLDAALRAATINPAQAVGSVSYTHLDVYKRQLLVRYL